MTPEHTSLLTCPKCPNQALRFPEAEWSEERILMSGSLRCPACAAVFPVVDGIPRFVPSGNYAASFGYQWNRFAKTQLDSNVGLPISAERVAISTGWAGRLEGERILEAGSGAGRFTQILLKTGAEVFSFDYSTAVDANRRNNSIHSRLALFQGDIFAIPLKQQAFDKVFCLGVLQHTPDPRRAFLSLANCVKPGGELVVDVYAKRLTALLSWKYVLRPITKRLDKRVLHRIVERSVDVLLPLAVWLRSRAGRFGARLLPIVEYSNLGLSPQFNREWAILDTFDMYSPAHDHPQSSSSLRSWFKEVGFENVEVCNGPNGYVGRGRRPSTSAS